MASNAARQAAYRQRQQEAGAVRFDVVVDRSAADALGRLAKHRGQPIRQTLEQIIGQAEADTLAGLSFLTRPGYFA